MTNQLLLELKINIKNQYFDNIDYKRIKINVIFYLFYLIYVKSDTDVTRNIKQVFIFNMNKRMIKINHLIIYRFI